MQSMAGDNRARNSREYSAGERKGQVGRGHPISKGKSLTARLLHTCASVCRVPMVGKDRLLLNPNPALRRRRSCHGSRDRAWFGGFYIQANLRRYVRTCINKRPFRTKASWRTTSLGARESDYDGKTVQRIELDIAGTGNTERVTNTTVTDDIR